jgi:exonuclease I
MASISDALAEADDLYRQSFRNVVIAMNSSNDFLFVDFDPSGFGSRNALQAIQRSGSYNVAAIFGWSRDRKTTQTLLRFRATPGFRTKESQESIVWEFRRQQCVQQVLKEEQNQS